MNEKTLVFSKICFGEDYYGQFHVRTPDDDGIDIFYKVMKRSTFFDN